MQTTEDKIAAYKARTGLFQGVQAGLDTEQISRMTTDLVTAQNDLAQAEVKLDAARGRQGASAQAAVAPNVVQMRVQMDTLNAQLQSLLTRLGPNHPDVISLRNQLRELQRARRRRGRPHRRRRGCRGARQTGPGSPRWRRT